MEDNMKTGLVCCGLIVVIALVAFLIVGNSNKPIENKTIEIEGIKFDTPVTNNNTTNFVKTPSGGITWAYEDYQNNVSVYVMDDMPVDVSTKQSYDELSGFNQMRPIGDKWFVVYADRQDDLEMIYSSAHMD